MLSIGLWITFISVLWVYLLWSRRRLYELMMKVPGPKGFPLIGSFFEFLTHNSFLVEFNNLIDKYGPCWLGWFGPVPIYFVSDPQVIQDLLTSPHATSKSPAFYRVAAEMLGNGLIGSSNPTWGKHRKALNTVFAHSCLLSFFPIFNSEVGILLQQLDKMVGQGEVALLPFLKNFTIRIATQTTMGTDIKRDEIYTNGTIVDKYKSALDACIEIILRPWTNFQWIRRWTDLNEKFDGSNTIIRTFIKKIINTKIAEATNNNSSGEKSISFVAQAVEKHRSGILTYEDVVDESHTIVTAAFETTAATAFYTLMLMAMFPEYQQKVFEEISSVFPESGNFNVDYDDLQKLEYLDMVLLETMRVLPALPITVRGITQDIKLTNGTVLPKGLQYCVSIMHTHRNKDVWGPDANMFDPEHCHPSRLRNMHSYALIPFLKGKRNCIGWKYATLSLKVSMTKILRNYKVSTSYRFEDISFVNHVTTVLKEMPGIKFERRV